MRRTRLLAVAAFWTGCLQAQSTNVSGPVEGFVFDAPTNSVRAVVGSLGSSTLAPGIVKSLGFASVAPGRNYAITVRNGQTFFVSGLGSNQLSTLPVAGVTSAPDGVVWSGDGSVAVAYSASGGWVQTLTGLPAAASASTPVSLGTLGGALAAVAVDTHGQTIVIGLTGDHAGVYMLTAQQAFFSPVLEISQPVSLAFSEDGGTVYALDASTNQVSELNIASLAIQTWTATSDTLVAIQPGVNSASQKVLYMADATGQSLLIYSRDTRQALASVPLSFSPTALQPLGAASFVVRARTEVNDPLWSFTDRGQPTVFFVPAVSTEPEFVREVLRK